MDDAINNQNYLDENSGLPDDEIINNFNNEGYRGFKEIKTRALTPVLEIVVKNKKGHTISATGETREEAIESIINQIDHYLDEK